MVTEHIANPAFTDGGDAPLVSHEERGQMHPGNALVIYADTFSLEDGLSAFASWCRAYDHLGSPDQLLIRSQS